MARTDRYPHRRSERLNVAALIRQLSSSSTGQATITTEEPVDMSSEESKEDSMLSTLLRKRYTDEKWELLGGLLTSETDMPMPLDDNVPLLQRVVKKYSEHTLSSQDASKPAVLAKQKGIIRSLLDLGENPEATDDRGTTALMCARHYEFVELLLRKIDEITLNATDAEGKSALMISVIEDDESSKITELLLSHGASPHLPDDEGRTVLMTAVWKNRPSVVELLLSQAHEASLSVSDSKGRNVWHHIAEDPDHAKDDRIVQALLKASKDPAIFRAQDFWGRTCLHWTAIGGNKKLARTILNVLHQDVDPQDHRGRTPLHLAAAYNHIEIAKLLLEGNANVDAESDGGWTPLHTACGNDQDSSLLVDTLVKKARRPSAHSLAARAAQLNFRSRSGKTPLHVACEAGNENVVKNLLSRSNLDLTTTDGSGTTPLLAAALSQHPNIVHLLAPWTKEYVQALGLEAIAAAKRFDATIVDFGQDIAHYHFRKRTVYDLLYRDPSALGQASVSPLRNVAEGSKPRGFRWIHLPANNVPWCRDLLTRRFVEEGTTDIKGFQALEKSFKHQHRGQRAHSHFMRPVCQTIPCSSGNASTAGGSSSGQANLNGTHFAHQTASANVWEDAKEIQRPPRRTESDTLKNFYLREDALANMHSPESPRIMRYSDPTGLNIDGRTKRKAKLATKAKQPIARPTNVYMFMPYLHFETYYERLQMQDAIERANMNPGGKSAVTTLAADELLIKAHMKTPRGGLHVRRTLDQFFYRNIDTKVRDEDQVVYRYQLSQRADGSKHDIKLLMRWRQQRRDPLNVLESIVEDTDPRSGTRVESVLDLAAVIVDRCFRAFDNQSILKDGPRFLDMFEASLGNAMDAETKLFHDFRANSLAAASYLRRNQVFRRFKPSEDGNSIDDGSGYQRKIGEAGQRAKLTEKEIDTRGSEAVEDLLDIEPETKLLAEIKDIRDELHVLRMVFDAQAQVLPGDISSFSHSSGTWSSLVSHSRALDEAFGDMKTTRLHSIKDIDPMDKQAERIYASVNHLLGLKQKHANAIEARFARKTADGTARQGNTVMVFTTVTVIFLPLSFIAAFFTINIIEFPHGGDVDKGMPLTYVSKFIFGIGLSIAIICVLMALYAEDLAWVSRQVSKRLWNSLSTKKESNGEEAIASVAAPNPFDRIVAAADIPVPVEASGYRQISANSLSAMASPLFDLMTHRSSRRPKHDTESGGMNGMNGKAAQ